jgi:hypothetical protein
MTAPASHRVSDTAKPAIVDGSSHQVIVGKGFADLPDLGSSRDRNASRALRPRFSVELT